MTSLQKTGEDVDSLCEEVSGSMFEDSIYLNATPTYVFEELKGLHHSAEHPLITKGLLASTKVRLSRDKIYDTSSFSLCKKLAKC